MEKFAFIFCLFLWASRVEGLTGAGAFTFESGIFPDSCILESGRTTQPKGETATLAPDETGEKASQVCNTLDSERGGVFIRSEHPESDPLAEPLEALTISLSFRSSPVTPSPVFLERLAGGSSDNPGFFRFRSQSNSGDTKERTGTFRLYLNTPTGESLSATSTAPWTLRENIWNSVALVFNRGRVLFYLNGERLGDEVVLPLEAIPGTNGSPYFLRAGYGFTGAFDDLVIVPGKALADEDIQKLHQENLSPDNLQELLKTK